MGLNIDEQKAVEKFKTEIVEPSMTQLVILDFWAEWCGPCKALTPVLEKVAANYADKGVVLKKVNVDEEKFIASQFQVRSIPTVYAMFQGQPVADLTQARTESQLSQMLDELLEKLPLDPNAAGGAGAAPQGPTAEQIEQMVTMGEQALASDDTSQAMAAFGQVIQVNPSHAGAIAGLIRTQLAAGQTEEAETMMAAIETSPELVGIQSDPAIIAAKSALELAKEKPDDGELVKLREAAKADASDMQAQIDFASAAFAAGERDEAADTLLAMVKADPAWEDGAAKAKLLQIFEAVGLEDEWVTATRRKLSLILFG